MGGWGPSKKDYYNADAIETEQDALDEEAEALRLQKQQLAKLNEDDYMIDDDWLAPADDNKAKGDEEDGVVTEVLPRMQITEEMGEQERLKLLHTWYPEVEHLRKDFLRLQPIHEALSVAASATEKLQKAQGISQTPAVIIKYRACASYLGAIAMYFALFTSPAAKLQDDATTLPMEPSELHGHPVMETLLKCKQLWEKVENVPIGDSVPDVSMGDELQAIEVAQSAIKQADGVSPDSKDTIRAQKPKRKNKAQLAAEAAQAEAEALRAEKIRKTEEELAALASLTDKSALRKAAKQKAKAVIAQINDNDSDIGDETELTAHELAEKAKKKKTLRFYTSKIVQKSNKRGAAGRDQGGDMDIPHRERLKDRQARLQAEAEKRGQKGKGPGVELGEEGDSDPEEAPPRGNDNGDDDEYYEFVSARSKEKKDAKRKLAAEAAAAAEGGRVIEEETIGADGKRKISYLIQKNKGLTPHRKKEVRNPRVKKKLKYAEKQKKLKSMKAVYSGGEGRGGYKGELTGIKKGLVKSVKL